MHEDIKLLAQYFTDIKIAEPGFLPGSLVPESIQRQEWVIILLSRPLILIPSASFNSVFM